MTTNELAQYIVSWTNREGSQRQLDAIIDASGLQQHCVDLAFDRAAMALDEAL